MNETEKVTALPPTLVFLRSFEIQQIVLFCLTQNILYQLMSHIFLTFYRPLCFFKVK